MRRVIIESPYAGDVQRNTEYLHACMRDCLNDRGEAPFASHGFYTQVLNDRHHFDRLRGMNAGFSWMSQCDAVAVYCDLGLSEGMAEGITRAIELGKPLEFRWLKGKWER